MRKMMAFMLLIVCCIGGLCWAHGTVSAQSDDVVITETVLQGDTAWAAGRTITTELNWERHLYWTTAYTLDGEYDTEFRFLQQSPAEEEGYGGFFSIWTYSSFGASGGEMHLSGDSGFAPMFRDAAENAPNGEETTVTVRVADYLDYYPVDIDITYYGENAYCNLETTDLFDYINGKAGAGKLNAVERYFNENFCIPVGEEDMAEISIYKTEKGYVSDVGMNVTSGEMGVINGISTETGIYFWVESYAVDGNAVASDAGPEGPGVYCMPWKETGKTDMDGRKEWMPDVDRVEQIYAMEPGTRIFITDSAQNDTQLRFLTWEDGWYVFTALDAASGEKLASFRLAQETDISDTDYPQWAWFGDIICTQIGDQVSLLWDHDGAITHEFTVPAGESDSFIGSWEPGYDAMDYDGEKLILVNVRTWYDDPGFMVCGYDREGLQLLADYDCSVMAIAQRIGYDNFEYEYPVIN